MAPKPAKVVHGDDLLYRFFQEFVEDRPELAVDVLSRMYITMGIWLPRDLYYHFPVLLPWVVRDPTCRANKKKGIPEQWGAPDAQGFLRDDNSLIKALTRSLTVNGAGMRHLHGARMGTEFVASHVWREVKDSALANRHPLLNSFVPNLVWLPSQVSKLTDREGEVMQRVLQAMAWNLYRNAPVAPHLTNVVEEAWSLIPTPDITVQSNSDLNHFVVTDSYMATRRSRLQSVIKALDRIEAGLPVSSEVAPTRYGEGLPGVAAERRAALRSHLQRFTTPTGT